MGLLVCGFCCRYLCHLPRSRHSVSSHCQPLQPTVLTSISHFIMSHHNSRRLAGSALLGVARRSLALLGDIDACKSRRSQISALLAGFAALVALAGVGSHNVQQQLAQVAEPWGGPLHPITVSNTFIGD